MSGIKSEQVGKKAESRESCGCCDEHIKNITDEAYYEYERVNRALYFLAKKLNERINTVFCISVLSFILCIAFIVYFH